MPTRDPITDFGTLEVTNQPPMLAGYNLFDMDPALAEAIRREGASWTEGWLRAFGGVLATAEILEPGHGIAWGLLCNATTYP